MDALLRAVGSVFVPGMLGVFIVSVGVALLALIGFVIGATSIVSLIAPALVSDPATSSWLPWATGVGAALFAYFLFPGIMPVVVNFFDSKIAALIEAQDYPAAKPIDPPFWPEFWHDARFSLKAILLNILVLPLYFVPVINLFVFYALNGHLLGKEFFVMVARRHQTLPNALVLRLAHRRTIFIAGIILTILATIPFLNLLAPFWGIAVMTHLYHALTGTPRSDILKPLP